MKNAGFTLIELIMVIVILGILAAVAVPKYFNLQDDAKIAAEMGVAGAVRSGISMLHGSLITKYASINTGNNNAVTTVLQEVTGVSNINQGYDTDRDGWLQRLQVGGGAHSSNLFEFVMRDPLAGGTDGGSDGWIKTTSHDGDNSGNNESYTGPASNADNGVTKTTDIAGSPDNNDHWEYAENDGTANDTGDGRFSLVDQ